MNLSKPFKDLSVLETSIVRAVLGEDIRYTPSIQHSAVSCDLSSSPVNVREGTLAVQAGSTVLAVSDADDGAVACTVATPLPSSLLPSNPTSTLTSAPVITSSLGPSLSADPAITDTNIAPTHNMLPVHAVSHTHCSTLTSLLPLTERNSSNEKQREHDSMIEIEEKQYMKAKAIFDFITPSASLAFYERGMKRKQYDYNNDYNNDYYDDNCNDGDNGDDDSSSALDRIAGTGTIERDRDNVGNSESVEDAVTSSESSSSNNNDCNSYNRDISKNSNNNNNAHSINNSVNNKKSKKKKKKKNKNCSTISSIDDNKSEIGIGLSKETREEEDEGGGGGGIGIGDQGGGVGAGVGVESLESESLRSLLGFSSFKSSYKNN